MKAVLISTYELGRQPFGLASPAAWLREEGCSVHCLDLAVQQFDDGREILAAADLIAFYLPMHTATRLAAGAVPEIRRLNPEAHLCFYGLYAPLNEAYLRDLGAETVLGGEFEQGLLSLARRLRSETPSGESGDETCQREPLVSLERLKFQVPDRAGLPALNDYARLEVAPGQVKTVGYTEASRGCKHRCRHCPVVPVYEGNFRIVQRDVVLEDIRRQVAAGAEHITFGDPDFFNGPTHAMSLVQALHQELPELTYDVTIKVEHLLKHHRHLPSLRDTGCLFVTCAVESVDDRIIEIFEKNHTREDFIQVARLFQQTGLAINPTFVTFTPWTTLEGYLDLLHLLLELRLVDYVSPIQYAIRLLITSSSRLLELPEVQEIVEEFDQEMLSHPWVHADPRVDRLHEELLVAIKEGQEQGLGRREIFLEVWRLAHRACDGTAMRSLDLAELDQALPSATVPYLTEPWYC